MGSETVVWLLAGAAAVVGLAAILASDIRVEASLKRKQNDDTVRIRVTALYGLVRWQKVVPVLPAGDGSGDLKPFFAFFKMLRKFGPWVKETALGVRCLDLAWVTRIGLGDAAASAIAAGAVWGIKSPLVGAFTRLVRMQAMPRLAVVPLFNETRFETELTGRFRLRTASALMAAVRLLRHMLRTRGGIRPWRQAGRKKKREERGGNRRKRRRQDPAS